jgi:uncharacterized protein (DUF433 family)
VASYNAGINIVVSGQDRLNYVLNSVDKLSAVLAKLKPINLLAPGAGSGGDAIRVAKKQLDDFTRAIVNFQPQGIQKRAKELSNTLAGASEQASALSTVLANVGLKSGGFKQQAVEVRNYALALDTAARNAARVNTISQAVQRGARVQNIASRFNVSTEQVEQRLANIREAAAKRQAQLDAAERQRDVQKLLLLKREEDFEIRLGRIRERNAAADAKRKGRTSGLSDALIGGAFPLLFGQGIGASAGGALGGFAGAKIAGGKGGFGGSLAGTIVGQATIDFAINSAVKLGQALLDPTEKIDDLIGFLGIAGTELNANIKVLRTLGLSSTASAVALAKLEATLQKEGFKNAQEFGKDLQTLTNAFGRLQLAAANLAAGALPGILDALTEILKGAGQAPLAPVLAPKTKSPAEAIAQAQAFNFIGPQPDPSLTAERVAQQAVTEEKRRQISLATAQKNLEADTLSLTRVDLATRQGAVAIQQVQNDLARKQLELKNETTAAAKELLGLEVQVLKQQEQQAQAAQRNAQIQAKRDVDRQIGGLLIEQTDLENQIAVLNAETAKLTKGELAGLDSVLQKLDTRRKNELDILDLRQELDMLGINENKVLEDIATKYYGLRVVAQQRYNIEKVTTEQQKAQYDLTRQQVEQARELTAAQSAGQAGLQIKQLQSFADPAGIGFFGDALLNQKLALEEFSVTVSNFDLQLLQLNENLAKPGLGPDAIKNLNDQKLALEGVIASYTLYQPQIIQARLEQEKFNTVFGAVSPLVDNVFNSFTNLIAGTMSAKEAFASFLTSIADMLADTAKKMIAQYIAIGVARMFAGISPGGNAGGFTAGPLAAVGDVGTGFNFDAGAMLNFGGFKAKGGPVSSGQTYMVGERGPELFVPGRSGTIVANDKMGGGSTNVVVNVDASGSNVEGDAEDSKQLGRVIAAAIQQELVKQKRPGGLLA